MICCSYLHGTTLLCVHTQSMNTCFRLLGVIPAGILPYVKNISEATLGLHTIRIVAVDIFNLTSDVTLTYTSKTCTQPLAWMLTLGQGYVTKCSLTNIQRLSSIVMWKA